MQYEKEKLKKEGCAQQDAPYECSVQNKVSVSEDLRLSRTTTFTTENKFKHLTWHKQTTVKKRCCALQESFFPTVDVPYNAVKQRMANLLGIVDRASVLAYLGRPQTKKRNEIDQEVTYVRNATRIQKRHTFIQKLPAKKGYIETFNLGYCYIVNDEWFIHWNHVEQLTLPQSEGNSQNCSVENFSLSKIAIANSTPNNQCELNENIETAEKRESVLKGERNSGSESILHAKPFSPNLYGVKPLRKETEP